MCPGKFTALLHFLPVMQISHYSKQHVRTCAAFWQWSWVRTSFRPVAFCRCCSRVKCFCLYGMHTQGHGSKQHSLLNKFTVIDRLASMQFCYRLAFCLLQAGRSNHIRSIYRGHGVTFHAGIALRHSDWQQTLTTTSATFIAVLATTTPTTITLKLLTV